MNEDKGVMKMETVLPEGFMGTFYFTNATDEEFIGVWGKKEYHFPAQTTSPMIMPEFSALEIQHIRKKFAKDLGEREFFKTQNYEDYRSQEGTSNNRTMSGIHQAATYNVDKDLAPFILKCLEPLPAAHATISQKVERPLEEKLSRNEEGELNTQAVDKKTSLRKKALDS